jgi:hypothetical protein
MGQRSRKRRSRVPQGSVPSRTREPRKSSEERNAEVRAQLEPLKPGERPGAVTAAAVVAVFLALANFGAYLAGLEIDGERPAIGGILLFCLVMLAAAYGLWMARYWAVLGFQCLLVLLIVIFFLLLMQAQDLIAAAICVGVIAPSSYMFFKLIRAMARIQMPQRPGT